MITKQAVMYLTLAIVAAAAVGFAIGDSIGQRSLVAAAQVQLDDMQASLAFNRLLDERKLKSLLLRRCLVQAASAIDVAEDKDMELLAGFVNGSLSSSTIKYISDRDPDLIPKLKTFKSKYGDSWSETECKG